MLILVYVLFELSTAPAYFDSNALVFFLRILKSKSKYNLKDFTCISPTFEYQVSNQWFVK